MADQSSVDFLPQIFQTPLNKRFLKATLDQVTQEPIVKITEGYIGHHYGAGVLTSDRYVTEPSLARKYYQFEPSVVFLKDETNTPVDAITYLGYLDAINLENGNNRAYDINLDNPVPLFEEQFYSWSPFIDFDKMSNYAQYYWLPQGPNLITINAVELIDLERDVFGNANYTTSLDSTKVTPAGLKFTNGLKIQFTGNVIPSRYKDKTYIVEGVGVSIQLVEYADLEIPDIPAGLQVTVPYDFYPYDTSPYDGSAGGNKQIDYVTINRASPDLNPWSRQNRWFHIDVVRETARVLNQAVILDDNYRAQRPIIEFVAGLKLFNFGTEAITNIGLIDTSVTNAFVQVAGQTTYTYDGIIFFDGMTVIFPNDTNPEVSNKVFRVEVIQPNSENPFDSYLNLVPTGQQVYQDSVLVCSLGLTQQGLSYRYDNNQWILAQQKIHNNQAPLFDLYDVNEVSFSDTYVYPGSTFIGNPIFTYRVGSGTSDSVLKFPLTYRQLGDIGDIVFDFNLYADNFTYLNGTTVVTVSCRTGFVRDYTTRTSYTREIGYVPVVFEAKQQQVFVVDYPGPSQGFAINVSIKYNESTQRGDYIIDGIANGGKYYSKGDLLKIFGAQLGGVNGWYVDGGDDFYVTVTEVDDVGTVTRVGLWNGFGGYAATLEQGTFTDISTTKIGDLTIDIPVVPRDSTNQNPLQISIDSQFLSQNKFSYIPDYTANTTTIFFADTIAPDTVIALFVLSDIKSSDPESYYEIPINLEVNPLNLDLTTITLNGVTAHYASACQNIENFTGDVVGLNNSRDLGPISPYATSIIQHSAAVPISGLFLRNNNLDLFDSLDYNAREYEKFKQLVVETAYNNEYFGLTTAQVLDNIIEALKSGKVPTNPFYWTDMIPATQPIADSTYTFVQGQLPTYSTIQTYDFDNANYRAILIYINETQAIRNIDYIVTSESATVTITKELASGDTIQVIEYATTYGTFVPATPTKLGLYPRFLPSIYLDSTFQRPTYVIQGHDGSITPAFGNVDPVTGALQYDIRDAVLLEYELRVYNNIKVNKEIPLVSADYISAGFRTTPYTRTQTESIENFSFLQWVGLNKIEYNIQNYLERDQFTWNYRYATTTLGETNLPGFWRGIYEYYYDTAYPHVRPWEMLGFSEEPVWWQAEYGPAPYTSGNLYMWWDLRDGYIRGEDRYVAKYARPQLLEILPVDPEGNLLSPFESMLRNYDYTKFVNSWKLGDVAPAENAWRTSSTYPFALQKLMAALKPAKYFTYNIDRDFYRYDPALNQWLYKGRNRLTNTEVEVYGDGIIKNSYINFIVEYNKVYGLTSTDQIKTDLKNIDVRLTYRVAGYTDKRYLQLIVDKSTPLSNNRSLLVPDESYDILLYKNEVFDQVTYSAISILITDRGYQVYGNSGSKPYFVVSKPVETGRYQTRIINSQTYFFPEEFSGIQGVPYGYTFLNKEEVISFLCGYGHRLKELGVINQQQENYLLLDWPQMAEEFVYWTDQNWGTNTLYQLNPSAQLFEFQRDNSVVVSLTDSKIEDILVNQNRLPLLASQYDIDRQNNNFKIATLSENNVGYITLKLTSYEHILILNNSTIFNDVIYEPFTGLRQDRILFKGIKSGDWNGTLDAPGFIINLNNVDEWNSYEKYSKGQIVKYKNLYYQAMDTVNPSADFDYAYWTNINYNASQIGLLPNLATKAVEMTNFYDQYIRNLDGDADLLGYGITGFRPRDYLSSIDLSLVSQINVYNDFIRTKGTANALGYFNKAIIDNSTLEYSIYENWAIQRALYGSTATNAYFDLVLDATKLYPNPSTIELIRENSISIANQPIPLPDIYDASTTITTPNVLPALEYADPFVGLPSAGYVNSNDVSFQLFNIDLFSSIDAVIDQVTDDSIIWVAKSNAVDWNVYKCQGVNAALVSVTDNLSGQCLLTFDRPHNLVINDRIIIRNANAEIDGAYQIRSVPSPTKAIIDLTLTASTVTTVYVTAVALVLKSVRVKQPSDIAKIPFLSRLEANNKIWIDNSGDDNKWEVVERQPFFSTSSVNTAAGIASIQAGAATIVSNDNRFVVFGAPNYSLGNLITGSAYLSNTVQIASPIFNNIETVVYSGAGNFGNAMAIGSGNIFAIGATTTAISQYSDYANRGYVQIYEYADSTVTPKQLIVETNPNYTFSGSFGSVLAMSEDESTLLISNGKDQVSILKSIPYQQQSVTYTVVSNNETVFSWANNITVVYENQITVYIDDILQPASNYAVDLADKIVTFNSALAIGSQVKITRRQTSNFNVSLNLQTITTSPNIANGTYYTANAINGSLLFDQLIFSNANVLLNPGVLTVKKQSTVGNVTQTNILRSEVDYYARYNSVGNVDLLFTNQYFANSNLTVEVGNYYSTLTTVYAANLNSNVSNTFGSSLAVDKFGSYFYVGDADQPTTNPANKNGKVYVLGQPTEKFFVNNANSISYWETGAQVFAANLADPFVYVYLNGTLQFPQSPSTGSGALLSQGSYTYNRAAGNIAFLPNTLTVEDIIEIRYNDTFLSQTLTTPLANTQVGSSLAVDRYNTHLLIGAPNDSTTYPYAGSVSHFVNYPAVYGSVTTGIISNNSQVSIGGSILINDFRVTFNQLSNTAANVANVINTSYPANVNVMAVANPSGTVTIGLKNANASSGAVKLQITPAYDTANISNVSAYTQLAVNPYVIKQTIVSATPVENGRFGSRVAMSADGTRALITTTRGTSSIPTTFDSNTTTFDARTTLFDKGVPMSGSVEYLNLFYAATPMPTNPDLYGIVGQISDRYIKANDLYGQGLSISRDGLGIVVGSPANNNNHGRVSIYSAVVDAFKLLRKETVGVNSELINEVLLYKKDSKEVIAYLDFIDPLQGKILGAARQNINTIGTVDPAQYNINGVNNYGLVWQAEQIGQIWWNTSNVRFINYHQDDINENALLWSTLFPGSSVDVYQWIVSSVPPTIYPGPGTPYSYNSYTVYNGVDATGKIVTEYYFWVTGLDEVNVYAGKTLSTNTIANYIENPNLAGIPYIAAINPSTVAIYNLKNSIVSESDVLHIDYDIKPQDEPIYAEFDLIKEKSPTDFLGANLYDKMVDSYAGQNSIGQPVPDPKLKPGTRTGTQFRPRQSFFADRYNALKNYIVWANKILQEYAIADIKPLTYFNMAEQAPSATAVDSDGKLWWNTRLENNQQLSYQDIYVVDLGYRYLIEQDSTQQNNWSIYQVDLSTGTNRVTNLIRTQSYNTADYWHYTNWYAAGFDPLTRPVGTYEYYANLATIQTPIANSVVRVNNSSNFGYELYQYQSNSWVRVGLENGTIQIDSIIYDRANLIASGANIPYIETRNIIKGLNEEIFTTELIEYRNDGMTVTFKYIISEQINCNWLMKTSLIDVAHPVGSLQQYPTYKRDNQDFVLSYINETKPYHVQIKDFNLVYATSLEDYTGDITDFDLPATYNTTQDRYISPIIEYAFADPAYNPNFGYSATPNDSSLWLTQPYRNWYYKYGIKISRVIITNPGSGYTRSPDVTINTVDPVSGISALSLYVSPVFNAVINGLNQVESVEVVNGGLYTQLLGNDVSPQADRPGAYYVQVEFTNTGGGTGATATVEFTTAYTRGFDMSIKYDRLNLAPTFKEWIPSVVYLEGALVRFGRRIWRRNSVAPYASEGLEFNFNYWTLEPAGSPYLDGTDRTYGYYLGDPIYAMTGLVYPGVRLQRGFSGTYDTTPYATDPYESDYSTLDTLLQGGGWNTFTPGPAVQGNSVYAQVAGGGFVDVYSSRAPEELIPGATFDVLDMTVNTSVGQDVSRFQNQTGLSDGWGSQVNSFTYNLSSGLNDIGYGSLLKYVHALVVTNLTTNKRLLLGVNYSINYLNQTITITSGYLNANFDNIVITAYSIGGGFQLYRTEYVTGATSPGNTVYVPVPTTPSIYYGANNPALLSNVVVLANMMPLTVANITADTRDPFHSSNVRLTTNIPPNSRIDIVGLGVAYNPDYPYGNIGGPTFGWSLPQVSLLTPTSANYTATLANYNPYPSDTNLFASIVEADGLRLRGTSSITYVINGANAGPFKAPYQTGVDFSTLSNAHVNVWINNSNTYGVTNAGVFGYQTFNYTAVYNSSTDDLDITLAQAPSLANTNVRVTISVTASNVDYSIANGIINVKNQSGRQISVTDWYDDRQQMFDNRVFVGKTYDINANSSNNVITAAAWDNANSTLRLGYVTTGFWFGNSVFANISGTTSNVTGNFVINGIPYDFDRFSGAPFSLGNIVIVDSIALNENEIPIRPGDRLYINGSSVSSATVQTRTTTFTYPEYNYTTNTWSNVTATNSLPAVIPFVNYIGQTKWAVLLDTNLGNTSHAWTTKTSNTIDTLNSVMFRTNDDNPVGENLIMAVGDHGTVIYSYDMSSINVGNTFTSANVNVNVRLNDLDTNSDQAANTVGVIAVVGDYGNIFTASSYVNTGSWTSQLTGTSANLYGITYIPQLANSAIGTYKDEFLAVGENGTILRSNTGSSWSSEIVPNNPVLRKLTMTAGNTSSVRYTTVGDNGAIYDKLGSGSWSVVNSPAGNVDYYGLYANTSGVIVTVGSNGAILTSQLPGIWQQVGGARSETFFANGNATFTTATVYVNDGKASYYANGVTEYSQITVRVNNVVQRNGFDYAVNSLDPVSITFPYSTPAVDSEVVISGIPETLRSVVYTSNLWIATGDNGVVLSSNNAVDWQQTVAFTNADINGVAYDVTQGKTIAVGSSIPTNATYQNAAVTTTYQALVMSTNNLTDVTLEFSPNLANVVTAFADNQRQQVTGEYILKQSLVTGVDQTNRTITINNPLNKRQLGPHDNILIRIQDVELVQEYDVGLIDYDLDKLWVTVDGGRIFENEDFRLAADGRIEIYDSVPVANASVVQILTTTRQSIPNELDFKVFKDMRDNPFVYSLYPNVSTTLTADVNLTANTLFDGTTLPNIEESQGIIYVADSSALYTPANGEFGFMFVGPEMIAYRYKNQYLSDIAYFANGYVDTANSSFMPQANCVSGLVRGLGGTPWLSDAPDAAVDASLLTAGNVYHLVGQEVFGIGPNNYIPELYRDHLEISSARTTAGTLIQASRSSNIAQATVQFQGSRDVRAFTTTDLLTVVCSDSSFNANSIAISNLSVTSNAILDLTYVDFNYTNQGSNIGNVKVSGVAGKVNFTNKNLRVHSNADVLVSVAGTLLQNPHVQFSISGEDITQSITANTAEIANGMTLMATANSQIYVTVDGPNVLSANSYTVSQLNPVVVTFNPNAFSDGNANVIITAQTLFATTSLNPVTVIVANVPFNNQIVKVGADLGRNWYSYNSNIGLQQQDTPAGEFFRGA